MALFTGDLREARLRKEHKEFQHHRANKVHSNTNASTYLGSWFSMASIDGINIESRRAEKYCKRNEYEVWAIYSSGVMF